MTEPDKRQVTVTPLDFHEKATVVARYLPGRTEYYLDHKGIRTRHETYEEAKALADKANNLKGST